jgi:hypothetical protein
VGILDAGQEVDLRIRKALKRFRTVGREAGLKGVAGAVFQRVIEVFILERSVACFEIPLRDARGARDAPPGVTYGELASIEIDELGRFSPHVGPREIRGRLKRGHLCHVARYQGRIVFCGWAGGGDVSAPVIGRTLRLQDGWAYAYNVYTHPMYRGRALFPLFVSRMAQALREKGFTHCMTLVDLATGIPVRAYVRTTGAKGLTIIHYRRIAGLRKSYREDRVSLDAPWQLPARRSR